jgi:hypothetical protein
MFKGQHRYKKSLTMLSPISARNFEKRRKNGEYHAMGWLFFMCGSEFAKSEDPIRELSGPGPSGAADSSAVLTRVEVFSTTNGRELTRMAEG